MLRKALKSGLVLACALLIPCLSFADQIKIGVLASRGAGQAQQEWKATANHLSIKLGKPFVVVPLGYDQFEPWVKEGKVDFIYANSAQYAEFNKLYGVQAIATVINQYKNQQMDQMAGTIVVKRDSPVKTVQDFKGKNFATASRSAYGGWLMTERLFLESGINPARDLKSLREVETHDNVIWAVLNGAVDGGSVRSGNLEKMAGEGKIKMEDLRVINQVNDGFPLVHSTPLYPEYPMAAGAHVPASLRNDVAQALLGITASDQAAVNAKIAGWKKPLDYTSVVELLTFIKYGAFAK